MYVCVCAYIHKEKKDVNSITEEHSTVNSYTVSSQGHERVSLHRAVRRAAQRKDPHTLMVSALEGRHTAKGLFVYLAWYHMSSQIPSAPATLGSVQPQGHGKEEHAKAATEVTFFSLE